MEYGTQPTHTPYSAVSCELEWLSSRWGGWWIQWCQSTPWPWSWSQIPISC